MSTGPAVTVGEVDADASERRPTCDDRPTSTVGRDARLELVFGVRRGRTVLLHGYAEPPFRVSRPFEAGEALHMILTSAGPGVFGGDCLRLQVRVMRGARVRLTSQSAVQVHPDASGARAALASTFDVEDGARLVCQWLPLIPFAASRLMQRIAVRLTPDAGLHWSDAFMAGRSAGGERWQMAELDHELRVVRAESLEYLERYRIDPVAAHLTNRWIAGDAVYFGTTITSGLSQRPALIDSLQAGLASMVGVHAAVDSLSPTLSIARLMSANGPAFHEARGVVDAALAPPGTLQFLPAAAS